MSSGRGGRRHRSARPKINVGDGGREVLEGIDESSHVVKQFRSYALELDAKHDRFERIVKLSRDITIESKRIIFLLHTIDRASTRETILSEAESRIKNLTNSLFKKIAGELEGQEAWQFIKAYRAGLQEFIEAVTFYHYLLDNAIPHWDNLDQSFEYKIPMDDNKGVENSREEVEERMKNEGKIDNEKSEGETLNEAEKIEAEMENPEDPKIHAKRMKILRTLLPPLEYILGVADLTGELMRKCINNLATGDVASCYQTCDVVREMYKGFLGCNGIAGKEVSRKVFTLKQSLEKIENVCYMIKVRGEEIPKHMLAEVAITTGERFDGEEDEGFQGF